MAPVICVKRASGKKVEDGIKRAHRTTVQTQNVKSTLDRGLGTSERRSNEPVDNANVRGLLSTAITTVLVIEIQVRNCCLATSPKSFFVGSSPYILRCSGFSIHVYDMLQTQVRYLARDDSYQREKPYAADFEVNEKKGVRKSNFIIQNCDIQVKPTTSQSDFNLDVNGFCILEEDTSLTLEDALDRPEQAEFEYQAQLEQILHMHFPAYARLEALDFVASRPWLY